MLFKIFPALFLLLALAVSAAAINLEAIAPASAIPGERITLIGGPFPTETQIVIGGQTIIPAQAARGQLSFTLPQLPEGEYTVTLISAEEREEAPFILRILSPAPKINSVSPTNIDECSMPAERVIVVQGDNLAEGTLLLLDGASIAIDNRDERHLFATLPPLPGGLHEIQAVNPNGQKSIPVSIFINSIPQILSVRQGTDQVTSYELIIEGKNFLSSSMLLVNGRPVSRTLSGFPTEKPAPAPGEAQLLQYIDCNTLIYLRYPSSREIKRLSLQVVNPGGKQSPVFFATAP